MGYSVGRFEGNTLVVDTDRIDYPYFDDLGTPQSADLKVRERFTLLPDARRLTWTAEIVDPHSVHRNRRHEDRMAWIPGHEIKPFDCALKTAE